MKWQKTQFPGVRFREHPSNRHNGRPDRYFILHDGNLGGRVLDNIGVFGLGFRGKDQAAAERFSPSREYPRLWRYVRNSFNFGARKLSKGFIKQDLSHSFGVDIKIPLGGLDVLVSVCKQNLSKEQQQKTHFLPLPKPPKNWASTPSTTLKTGFPKN